MAYIGNTPALQYITFAKQTFTADSSTVAFTLDNSVANENELEVFVNNVRQEPGSGKAYTASGTTLTMSEAPTTGDDFYCIYQGKATQTVTPGASTVTNAMLAGSIDLTSKVTGTLPIANGGIGATTLSGAGLASTPAFRAYRASSQSISDATETKVQFDTEDFDTDNCYDNSTNYRFTPTTAGKYFVYAQVNCSSSVGEDIHFAVAIIKKNGSEIARNNVDPHNGSKANQTYNYFATVVDLNGSSDYLEVFGTIDTSTGTPSFGDGTNQTYFGAYKLIGV